MPNLPADALDHLKSQTSFQFTANNTLFAYNTFDNNGDIYWDNEDNLSFDRPTDMWFYRNDFHRSSGQGKLLGDNPKVTKDVLVLHGNSFSNFFFGPVSDEISDDDQVPQGAFRRWSHPDGWKQLPLGSSRVGDNGTVGTMLSCG